MRRIIYISHATECFAEAELFGIISVSARKNGAAGLSGFLLYSNRRFLQLLEGPSDILANTYAVIERDKRHHDCRIVVDETSSSPCFPSWSMRRIPNAESARPAETLSYVKNKADGEVSSEIMAAVQSFLTGAMAGAKG